MSLCLDSSLLFQFLFHLEDQRTTPPRWTKVRFPKTQSRHESNTWIATHHLGPRRRLRQDS